MLTASSDAILWRGVDHAWTYNHRWGRLGSGFVRVHPEQVSDAWPLQADTFTALHEGPTWTYMGTAGAGAGIDFGDHQASGTRLTAPHEGVHFASTTAHTRLEGAEGKPAGSGWTVSVSLPEAQAADLDAGGELAVVLNGYWLQSVGDEAKQPACQQLLILLFSTSFSRPDDARAVHRSSSAHPQRVRTTRGPIVEKGPRPARVDPRRGVCPALREPGVAVVRLG
jgi:hypothetical protein